MYIKNNNKNNNKKIIKIIIKKIIIKILKVKNNKNIYNKPVYD